MSTLGLLYNTDLASKPGLPVNLPFFWKFMLGVPTKESGFVDAGNKLINDLFHDITNYYLDRDIRTCNMFQKHLYRIIKFRYYSGFSTLSTTQQTELKANGFIYPNLDGTPGIDYKYDFHDYVPRNIGVIADSFYNPEVMIKQDVNFELDDELMTFLFNPVEGDASFKWSSSTYVTSGGVTLSILECNLIAINIELWESPLWQDYGCLVYTDEYDPTSETEQEYRQKIIGLFLLYYNGMKINVLNAAVNTMLGMPVFLYEHETIRGITSTEIITDKTTYTYDSTIPLHSKIYIGSVVNQFDTIHSVIEIVDHLSDPDWIDGISIPDFLFITPETANMNSVIDCTTTQDLKASLPPFKMDVNNVSAFVFTDVALNGLTWNNSDEGSLYFTAEFRNNTSDLTINLYPSTVLGTEPVARGSGRLMAGVPQQIYIDECNNSGISGVMTAEHPGIDLTTVINISNYFSHVADFDDTVDVHFDLFNIKPKYVPGELYPQIYTNNYYIWDKYFKSILFNIKILANYITFDRLESLGIIDEVLPLNVYYLRTDNIKFSEVLDLEDSITDTAEAEIDLDPPT